MKWGLKGEILFDADSGPLRYLLWCCGSICHQLLTFIQIGYGHTVISTGYLYSGWGIPSSIMPKYDKRLFLIKGKKSTSQFSSENWALLILHTIYTRNNMGQKCGGNCGLWVLNEILKKTYAENLKKMWVPFGSYLLNSTANSAQFAWK